MTLATPDHNKEIYGTLHDQIIVKRFMRLLLFAAPRIMDVQSHPVDMVPRRGMPEGPPNPVVIEDDAWLGAEVFVIPGVTIGRGSVIAARSVVTSDIPPMVLAAGVPAKVVRELRVEKS